MSFYRKYRPQVIAQLDNLKVREQIEMFLGKQVTELPHAFFLTGPKGTGKTTTARLLAKLFNCTKDGGYAICETCEQCVAISKGTSLDVVEMDAASNRGIDEIRQLRERIGLTPVSASYTVYIIDEVHMLTNEAFNALLKTLEEPPAHAVFILATTDPQKVPGTIASRCMHIVFHRAGKEELVSSLKRIVEAEKITITDDALRAIAESADGSFRDATKLLEQVSFTKGDISIDTVRTSLSLSDEQARIVLLSHLSRKDTQKALVAVSELLNNGGVEVKALLTQILSDLQDMLLSEVKGTVVPGWSGRDIRYAISCFTAAYGSLRDTPIAALPLQVAVVDICSRGDEGNQQQTKLQEPEKKPVIQKEVIVSPKTVVPSTSPVKKEPVVAQPAKEQKEKVPQAFGLLTFEKLIAHWQDFIATTKVENNSIAGVLRSTRPKSYVDGLVTIEAFYPFHQEKLSEPKALGILATVLKKLFGDTVSVQIVLGKK